MGAAIPEEFKENDDDAKDTEDLVFALKIWYCGEHTLKVTKSTRIIEIKSKMYQIMYQQTYHLYDEGCARCTYDDWVELMMNQRLCNYKSLEYYGITNSSKTLEASGTSACCGLANIVYNYSQQILRVESWDSNQPDFKIKSFHVSCKSDRYTKGMDMAGVVLYLFDSKTDWYLNGMHCKTGYIILKLAENIKHIKGPGMIHGACYKSVFERALEDDLKRIVGGGFAYYKGKWKFNSFTFNSDSSQYHDGNKAMNKIEIMCIKRAIQNWQKGIQNTYIKDVFDGTLCPYCDEA